MKNLFVTTILATAVMGITGCDNDNSYQPPEERYEFVEDDWYRDIRFADWEKMGLPEEDVLSVLAKIDDGEGLRDDTNLDQKGYWTYEFTQAGERVLKEAQAQDSADLYAKASTLYLVASYPNLRRSHEMYAIDKALISYVTSLQLAGNNAELVKIPLKDGATINGVLHRPASPAGSTAPAMIWTGGVDKALVEHFNSFKDLIDDGYAVLTLDMPGAGTDFKHSLKAEVKEGGEVVQASTEATSYQAAYDYLTTLEDINPQEVGILTSSGSGVALFEFVLNGNHNLKAVVARCTLVDGPLTQHEMVDELPRMSVDAMIARMGGDAGDLDYFRANAKALSLKTKGYFDDRTNSLELPILGINADGDPIATEEDLQAVVNFSSHPDSKVVITNEFGHCPERPEAETMINDFVRQHVGQ